MKNHPPISFLLILVKTIIGVVVNLSTPFKIDFSIPNPFTKQPVHVEHQFAGIPYINSFRDFSFRRGLDLQGGTSITLQADMKGVPQDQREDALESAKKCHRTTN